MKTEKYRIDGKHIVRFPLELIALDYAATYHDESPANIEKEIGNVWYELTPNPSRGDSFWADGINIVLTESNTELEFEIITLWNKRYDAICERDCQRDNNEKTRQIRAAAQVKIDDIESDIGKLQDQREAKYAVIEDDVGFDISSENVDDVVNILGAITKALQCEFPLMITGKKLHFRTGPFAKVPASTFHFACNEFHRFAKAKGLITD